MACPEKEEARKKRVFFKSFGAFLPVRSFSEVLDCLGTVKGTLLRNTASHLKPF
jgi:hypothetical protein